jgi:hypothetical protein
MIWRVGDDEHSLWGAIHGSGSSSRGDQWPEAVLVVAGSDLRAVEVCST